MSYCRWSSDGFKCDVYAYANVSGAWTVHVAGRRHVGDVPEVDWTLKDPDAIAASYSAYRKALDACTLEAIDLPHAGETFDEAGPAELADRLEMLRGVGYVVPQYAIDELREEAQEMDVS